MELCLLSPCYFSHLGGGAWPFESFFFLSESTECNIQYFPSTQLSELCWTESKSYRSGSCSYSERSADVSGALFCALGLNPYKDDECPRCRHQVIAFCYKETPEQGTAAVHLMFSNLKSSKWWESHRYSESRMPFLCLDQLQAMWKCRSPTPNWYSLVDPSCFQVSLRSVDLRLREPASNHISLFLLTTMVTTLLKLVSLVSQSHAQFGMVREGLQLVSSRC